MGLQICFSVVAIFMLSILLTSAKNSASPDKSNMSYSHLSWGFRQLADGGSVTQTLEDLDHVSTQNGNVPVVLVLALLAWIIGLILCGFVTGAIVNAFEGRKDKIKSGQARYKFNGHGLIIGWDYQGGAVVKDMFSHPQKKIKEILIVSETPAETITSILSKTLDESQMANIYIYNCSVNIGENIKSLQAEYAQMVVILGEENNLDKDGETLHTASILQKYIRDKINNSSNKIFNNLPIKLHLHIEDPVLYMQARAVEDGFVEDDNIDIELCNFYESWAWRCWSDVEAIDSLNMDSGKKYLPLRYKPDSERVELFVIGSDSMSQALINYAIPLLNYGKNHKHCRITLFDESGNGDIYLPKRHLVDSLPELEVVYKQCNGGSNEANDIMYEAVMRDDTSVTIIIAVPGADAAVKTYAALSHQIRRQKISVLVRQSTECVNCIDKCLLQNSGDNVELRYFGMTDILPWADDCRDKYGKDINYSWEIVNDIVEKNNLGQVETSGKFLELLKYALEQPYGEEEQQLAQSQWCGIKRWKRWSSINAGDSFKEKSFAFPDCTSNENVIAAFLKAEHNRWQTERLMAGWIFAEQKDDKKFQHPNLVEFEKLDAKIQAINLLCTLAMRNAGFFQ